MGLVGTVLATLFQYAGTARTSASNASVLVALEPVIIVIFSALILRERIGRITLISLVLALLGVLCITIDPKSLSLLANEFGRGNLLVLFSVACYSLYSIAGKSLTSRWSNQIITTFPVLISVLFLIPITLALEPEGIQGLRALTLGQWGIVLYLSLVATALTYLCWNWLLKHLSASFVSYSLYIQPIAGTFFSCLLLGERLTLPFFAGSGLIVLALLIEQRAM
jgi:drug/metabolite transporter (DMT)-like permease